MKHRILNSELQTVFIIFLLAITLISPIAYAKKNINPDILTLPSKPIPLSESNMNEKALTQWLSDALKACFIFDKKNYPDLLKANRQYFTVVGWKQYEAYLKTSDTLNQVLNKNYALSIELAKVKITSKGLFKKRYAWKAMVPAMLYFQSPSSMISHSLKIYLKIIREPTYLNPNGVGINRVIVK